MPRISKKRLAGTMPGEVFRDARERLGMTQDQVATVMGLSAPSVVSSFECERVRIPHYIARHLLLLLRVNRWEDFGNRVEPTALDLREMRDELLSTSPFSRLA